MKVIVILTLGLSLLTTLSLSSCTKECQDIQTIQDQLHCGTSPFDLFLQGIPKDSLIGKEYNNGLIFYLNTEPERNPHFTGKGLIASKEDLSISAVWGCDLDIEELPNVTDEDSANPSLVQEGARIGDGALNANHIFNAECLDRQDAAEICRKFGKEWVLPSAFEVLIMKSQLFRKGLGNFAEDEWYWSSSEINSELAWKTYFGNGVHFGTSNKRSKHRVRAIQYF